MNNYATCISSACHIKFPFHTKIPQSAPPDSHAEIENALLSALVAQLN